MIGTIRKHSKWLWVVISSVTILTFVYWGSSRYDKTRIPRGSFGAIDGERISKDEFFDARREVNLDYFFTHGTWPDRDAKRTGFDEERETYHWLFFVRKLKQYNVQIDTSSAAQAADENLRALGGGNRVPLDALVQQILRPRGISAEDFMRFESHRLGLQQLMSVVALSGRLITPEEAQFLYERDHQEFSTEAVFFSASNYLAGVPAASAEALAQFYTNEMSAYHVPERVQVSYVAFGVTNLLAPAERQLTNLNRMVESQFQQLGTNYLRFGKTPDEVRGRIREGLIRQQALAAAKRQADDFDNELFAMEPVQAGNLAALARTNGLTVKITAPFDEESGPSEFDGGPNFAKAAFSLNAEKPFPDQSIPGEVAVYVIALEKRIPDEILPLERIRDRVAADCRYRQAVLTARRAGQDFVRMATNGLAQGRTFAGVCADAKIKLVAFPPFSFSTRELPEVEDHIALAQFKQLAASTAPGKVSEFNPTPNGGVAVYVRQRLPVDEAKMRGEMPAFLNLIRRARVQEAANFWFMKEAPVSLRDTPLAQRSQPSVPPGQAQP